MNPIDRQTRTFWIGIALAIGWLVLLMFTVGCSENWGSPTEPAAQCHQLWGVTAEGEHVHLGEYETLPGELPLDDHIEWVDSYVEECDTADPDGRSSTARLEAGHD